MGTAVGKFTDVSVPMLAKGVGPIHASNRKNEGIELNPICDGISILAFINSCHLLEMELIRPFIIQLFINY